MSQSINTWKELCELAGIPLGETPGEANVEPIISGGYLAINSRDKNTPPDACCNRPDSCLPMQHSCCGGSCGCKH